MTEFRLQPRFWALALVCCLAAPIAAVAQLPPGVYAGTPDAAAAPAGRYILDPDHTAVIARVSHIGYSRSVFRFDTVSGQLMWVPGEASKCTLRIAVDTASIATPVAGFATKLKGEKFLNSLAFPQATFVSSDFEKRDATHGRVAGQLTLLGKRRPLVFDVVLGGAGKGFMGHPRIGVQATATIDPVQFGLPPMLGDSIQLSIDAEFAEAP